MKTIHVLMIPKVHLFDLACPVQVFYEANEYNGTKFRLNYVGLEATIQSEQQNVFSKINPIASASVAPGDVICVPGVDFAALQDGLLDDEIAGLRTFVHQHWQLGCAIISICTGSLVLAKMGLLNHRKCSTHWKCFDYMKRVFPKAKLMEESLFSEQDNIYTSAGMTSGIDMCLTYLEREYDPLLAAHVASEMVINIRRESIGDQKNTFLNYENKFHPIVYQVQQILQSRIHDIVQVRELAEELNMSARNLNRLFTRHAGKSIVHYRNEIKMKEAERLLGHSKQSVKEIANYLGYATEPYFNRVWRKHHQLSPLRYRKAQQLRKAAAELVD